MPPYIKVGINSLSVTCYDSTEVVRITTVPSIQNVSLYITILLSSGIYIVQQTNQFIQVARGHGQTHLRLDYKLYIK